MSMNDLERQTQRVVILAKGWNERALIAAQLLEESPCRVESAADLEDGLALLILRAALIILDWSDQEITADLWSKFRAAARGAPILILARLADREELGKLGIDPANILLRPFTVGDVVRRARESLGEARTVAEPMVANKELIEQIFDGAAEKYDRVGPAIFRKLGGRLAELTGMASGMRVLDIATGNGAVLIAAAPRVGPSGQVVGVDLSNEMLGQANAAARALGFSNVQLGRMDAESLEFPDGSFDAVTCAFSVFLFPSIEGALREMCRVCKPAGRLGVSVWGKTPPPFDPAWKLFADLVRKYDVEVRMPQRVAYSPHDIESLIRAAGFKDIQLTTETMELVYPSEEDWWSFQLTNGSRAAILRMSVETRANFKEEYLGRLRPLFQADGLHLPAAVIFAIASRQQTVDSQQSSVANL